MSTPRDLHRMSFALFSSEAETWREEADDALSLSKFSIAKLLERANSKNVIFKPIYLRAAALKREYTGASRFIYWAFAPTPMIPPSELFLEWCAPKSSTLGSADYDLPLRADFADEFLHLAGELLLLCDRVPGEIAKAREDAALNADLFGDLFEPEQIEELPLDQELQHVFFVDRRDELITLANSTLETAAQAYVEDPAEALLRAFENLGLQSRRTQVIESSTPSPPAKRQPRQSYTENRVEEARNPPPRERTSE